MEENLKHFFGSSLELYNKSTYKYKKYINQYKLIFQKYKEPIFENIKTQEQQEIFYSEIIGILYDKQQLFVWGWLKPRDTSVNDKISKYLINYALTINLLSTNDYYIRSILLNSRIKIDNNLELKLLLSLIYYLIRSTCDFIYPDKVYDKKGNLLYTIFRSIKISKNK